MSGQYHSRSISVQVDRLHPTVHADESGAWDALHASYPMLRVNHSREFKSDEGACTNEAESWFSRLRRAEIRHPSSDQRSVPLSVRKRDGVARGSPPRAERLALAPGDGCRVAPSEIGNLARLLAAERSMTIERPNTLAGLVEKRAEIAGQIAHTRAMLRQLIIDLDHAARLDLSYVEVSRIVRPTVRSCAVAGGGGD